MRTCTYIEKLGAVRYADYITCVHTRRAGSVESGIYAHYISVYAHRKAGSIEGTAVYKQLYWRKCNILISVYIHVLRKADSVKVTVSCWSPSTIIIVLLHPHVWGEWLWSHTTVLTNNGWLCKVQSTTTWHNVLLSRKGKKLCSGNHWANVRQRCKHSYNCHKNASSKSNCIRA